MFRAGRAGARRGRDAPSTHGSRSGPARRPGRHGPVHAGRSIRSTDVHPSAPEQPTGTGRLIDPVSGPVHLSFYRWAACARRTPAPGDGADGRRDPGRVGTDRSAAWRRPPTLGDRLGGPHGGPGPHGGDAAACARRDHPARSSGGPAIARPPSPTGSPALAGYLGVDVAEVRRLVLRSQMRTGPARHPRRRRHRPAPPADDPEPARPAQPARRPRDRTVVLWLRKSTRT